MRLIKFTLAMAALWIGAWVPVGYAGIYKCSTPAGQVTFQDRPCRGAHATLAKAEDSKQSVAASDKHFLWKATSKVNTVYLFGSIHFGSSAMYPLPDVVNKAYAVSDALVVEVNMHLVDPRSTALTLAETGSYASGETVEQHLSPETWQKLTRVAKSRNLDLALLQNQKPWMISMALVVIAIKESGFSPEFGIDEYFIKGAEGKKPIIELESAQQQMALLSTFSSLEQDKMLQDTLEQLENATVYFRSILESWRSGDTERLKDLMLRDMNADPNAKSLYGTLITKRNHSMAEQIVKLSESGQNYFVVVGAGHLVGEEGIGELLRAKGYEVGQL